MTLHVYTDLIQGTDPWLDARRGIVTASVVGQLISVGPPSAITVPCPECGAAPDFSCISRARKEPAPIKTLHASRVVPASAPRVIEAANNDTSRALTTLLAAERITGWSDPVYVNADMIRGTLDEPIARHAYAEHTGQQVDEVGFMVREEDGWRLGYSPDGLVGDDGLLEVKSRRPKKQVATILADEVPIENVAQVQTGLLVSGREWLDFVSFAGGMPLYVKRVYPDMRWFDAIREAVETFEENVEQIIATYQERTAGLPVMERPTHDLEILL